MDQPKSFLLLLLVLTTSSVASPRGVWQFPNKEVFVEIQENGESFQCRMDKDNTIYRAEGSYDGIHEILWEPIETLNSAGKVVDSDGFSWGKDKVTILDNTLRLTGPYGSFSYVRATKDMPMQCRS